MPPSQNQPKTPHRRSRSEVRTPLTPSLVAGLNAVSIHDSPSVKRRISKPKLATDAFETPNPFFLPARSRPASPIKRATSSATPLSEEMQRQAQGSIIRKGGVESRIDVITLDYKPPKKTEIKRSKSTSAVSDRFITTHDRDLPSALDKMSLNPSTSSPGHTARLIAATGVPVNRRILGYKEAPPPASNDTALAQQREIVRPLYTRTGATSSTGATTNKSRRIPTVPEKILDAPGMIDDFYLNLISWSCLNVLAVALENLVYLWKGDTGEVTALAESPEGTYVASVDFSNDGLFLGIGINNGDVELWDVESGEKLRTMSGHQNQVGVLSWNQHILSSGCADGSIWHHDVRIPRHKVMELLGHSGEVCGLKWRSDGELLASGGNDNVVNVWDGRVGAVGEDSRGSAKWTKRNHTAAVKGIAWCPWQMNLLASGGGTNDATIHVWNTTTGARLHSQQTPSQITSIQWAPHKKEILTTHGFPTNAIMVHAYPSMERVAEIRDAHKTRVLASCVGPAGDMICTAAGEEHINFWRIWDVVSANAGKKKREDSHRGIYSTSSTTMLMR